MNLLRLRHLGVESSSVTISAYSTNATTLYEIINHSRNSILHPVFDFGEKILSENQTTLGGQPAHIIFESHKEPLPGTMFNVFTLYNGREYHFMYSISTLDGMSPVFNMIDSFKFLK